MMNFPVKKEENLNIDWDYLAYEFSEYGFLEVGFYSDFKLNEFLLEYRRQLQKRIFCNAHASLIYTVLTR